MKTDPRCACTDCTLTKLRDSIDIPVPDIIKFETAKMSFLDSISYAKSTNEVFSPEDDKMIELIKKLDCYGEKNDILADLDLISLVAADLIKQSKKAGNMIRILNGVPEWNMRDNQKLMYSRLDNKKTIFDKKEIG